MATKHEKIKKTKKLKKTFVYTPYFCRQSEKQYRFETLFSPLEFVNTLEKINGICVLKVQKIDKKFLEIVQPPCSSRLMQKVFSTRSHVSG